MSYPSPTTMIRTLHIIGSQDSGGAERFFVRLVRALHESRQPVLAVSPPGSAVGRELGNAVLQQPVSMLGYWDPLARWRIRGLIAAFRPDIVQTYMGRATRLLHLPAGGKPVHVARLGGYYNLKGYRHAHAWIGNTQGIRGYLLDAGLPEARVVHIGNFVDVAASVPDAMHDGLRAALDLPTDAWIALGLGRLHPNKGYSDLLRACAALPDTIAQRPVRLVIVGDGPLREPLQREAEQLGIAARVRWAGWQNDVHAYYALCDVFVCPSVHEPLGNVILEAWAHERAVIATRTQGALELIEAGGNGVLVDCGDHRALGAEIAKLLAAPAAERARLAAAGRKVLEQRYSRAAIVAQYLDCYRALLSA